MDVWYKCDTSTVPVRVYWLVQQLSYFILCRAGECAVQKVQEKLLRLTPHPLALTTETWTLNGSSMCICLHVQVVVVVVVEASHFLL